MPNTLDTERQNPKLDASCCTRRIWKLPPERLRDADIVGGKYKLYYYGARESCYHLGCADSTSLLVTIGLSNPYILQ